MGLSFELLATDGGARRGRLTTAHAVVETPVFMPVGTQGTIKALTHRDVRDAGARLVLANTYHLHLRPARDWSRDSADSTALSAGTREF
jgi:queuine tRNA-ribosyltransferase